jgi:hypothetical protein
VLESTECCVSGVWYMLNTQYIHTNVQFNQVYSTFKLLNIRENL